MIGYLIIILLPHLITWGVLFWLFRSRKLGGTGKLINGIVALLWVAFAYQVTPWGLSSYYLQFVYPVVLLVLFLLLARKRSSEPRSDVLYRFRLNRYVRLIVISGLAVLNFLALLSSYYPEEEAIDLEIPFRQGTYYVMQGGNSPITNYFHRSHKSQQYALDITKLNNWGGRVNGLYSKDLNKYEVYGDTVLAPVSGKVLLAVDSFPDFSPPKLDKINPLGNHVRIVTSGRMVILAHLIPGSVLVKTGDAIQAGDPIGLVGNSGNSIEPHLHLQVVEMDMASNTPTWEPIPFRLNGEFYHLNDRISPK